jgi:acyl-coenzyme A synthetase/AMP-(fatty) acid ligase
MKSSEGFWDEAAQVFLWEKPYHTISAEPAISGCQWFKGGRIDYSFNILDRKIEEGKANKEIITIYNMQGPATRLTYGGLFERITGLCALFNRKGLKKRKKAIILLTGKDKLLNLLTVLAPQRMGILFGVLFEKLPSHIIQFLLKKSRAHHFIVDRTLLPSMPDISGLQIIEKDELVRAMGDEPYTSSTSQNSEAPSFFLFTSGTTSMPKIVKTGHAGFFIASLKAFEPLMNLKKTSTVFTFLNPAFGPAIAVSYSVLLHEKKLVMSSKEFLTGEELQEIVSRENITCICMNTFTIHKIIGPMLLPVEIALFGDRMNQHQYRCFKETFPRAKVKNGYGSMEYFGIGTSSCIEIKHATPDRMNLMKPFPWISYEIRNKDKTATVELWLKSSAPSLCCGYLKDNRKFRERFDKDFSHFNTKDMAREKQGHFEIIGRSDNLLKHKGLYLEPCLLEESCRRIPGVSDAKVVAADGRLILFVQGNETRELEKEITDIIKGTIGCYGLPSTIYFLPVFERTASGKILETKLKQKAGIV